VLPSVDEDPEPLEDPREDLVRRLLEYKKYKDAASILEEEGRRWQRRYARMADDLPPRRIDPADQPIHEVEMWDLVSAFGRVMKDHESVKPSNIVYDETPIQTYMQQIHFRLVGSGRASFSEMFHSGMHKSALIGVFLAILELVRHHCVSAEQSEPHGEIWIVPSENFSETLQLSGVDNYENKKTAEG
jgi:segregation and condensation protein A